MRMNEKRKSLWIPRSNLWAHTATMQYLQRENHFLHLSEINAGPSSSLLHNTEVCKGHSSLLPTTIIKAGFEDSIYYSTSFLEVEIEKDSFREIVEQTKDFLIQPNSVLPFDQSYTKIIYLVKHIDTDKQVVGGIGTLSIAWELKVHQLNAKSYNYELEVKVWSMLYETLSALERDHLHLKQHFQTEMVQIV